MPRRFISRARAWIISGSLTLACLLKLTELRVRLPMSGFMSPSRVRGSARCSNVVKLRPLKDTQTTSSGANSLMPAMISP